MVKFMWQKVKVKKKYTLRKEMTSLMLRTSAFTLLSAVLAILYVFFSFFFQKTQEDIEYVLKSTTQQYQSHMQFIADGAISIRHNILLDVFLKIMDLIEKWWKNNFRTVWNYLQIEIE